MQSLFKKRGKALIRSNNFTFRYIHIFRILFCVKKLNIKIPRAVWAQVWMIWNIALLNIFIRTQLLSFFMHSAIVVFLFYVQWLEVRGDCSFSLILMDCCSSLFKLSFHNITSRQSKYFCRFLFHIRIIIRKL